MSKRMGHMVVAALGLCIVGVVMAQSPSDRGGLGFAITSVQLEYGPVRLPLKQDHIVIRKADGSQEAVPIVMVERHYSCQLSPLPGEFGNAASVRVESVEVLALGRDGVQTWSQCGRAPSMGMFGVVTANDGKNYLTWAESWSIRFEELGQPADPLVGVVTYATRGRSQVPPAARRADISDLIEHEYQGRNVFYRQLSVDSIEFTPDGRTVLKVRAVPPHQDKVFTLVFDGKEWRREGGEPSQTLTDVPPPQPDQPPAPAE